MRCPEVRGCFSQGGTSQTAASTGSAAARAHCQSVRRGARRASGAAPDRVCLAVAFAAVLAAGADPCAVASADTAGCTPLHLAADAPHAPLVALLLSTRVRLRPRGHKVSRVGRSAPTARGECAGSPRHSDLAAAPGAQGEPLENRGGWRRPPQAVLQRRRAGGADARGRSGRQAAARVNQGNTLGATALHLAARAHSVAAVTALCRCQVRGLTSAGLAPPVPNPWPESQPGQLSHICRAPLMRSLPGARHHSRIVTRGPPCKRPPCMSGMPGAPWCAAPPCRTKLCSPEPPSLGLSTARSAERLRGRALLPLQGARARRAPPAALRKVRVRPRAPPQPTARPPRQADVDAVEPVRGRTPLHEALARGAELGAALSELSMRGAATAAALLAAGADAAARDRTGDTPMHYAAFAENRVALARMLAARERARAPPRATRVELSRVLLAIAARPPVSLCAPA
jgi:ankyrin repeat protein